MPGIPDKAVQAGTTLVQLLQTRSLLSHNKGTHSLVLTLPTQHCPHLDDARGHQHVQAAARFGVREVGERLILLLGGHATVQQEYPASCKRKKGRAS